MRIRNLAGTVFLVSGIVVGGYGSSTAQTHSPPVDKAAVVSPQGPADSKTVPLDELVREAVERNPEIQAAKSAVRAKQAMISPAKTLPDPMVTFQTMGDPWPLGLQTGDPSSARTVGIQQEIPFPGKLSLKAKIAEKEAEAESWNYEQTRRRVIADLKQAYYDLYYTCRALETVHKDKGLLEKFEHITQAKYRVGQGLQQDVLKAQVEISKLTDRLIVLERRRGATAAVINSLLNRPPETELGTPEEVQKADFLYSLEELYRMAKDTYPLLKIQELEIDRSHYAVDLAKKGFYPDFSLAFTYSNREAMPEMYAYMVGATVPLYFWCKQRSEVLGAESGLLSVQQQRNGTVAMLYSRLKEGFLAATASEELIRLYTKGIIPQARLSLESAVAGYQVGKVDFLTLVDNLVTLLEYELKYYEVLTDYQKALAQLEPLVGIELTR